ncbi:MAG: DUF1285 domain-containing protein [Bosea sp.]|nr:DUF1285 domain-containing protein [Bosea sp. (in: a-proteobacteria)]
MARSKQGETKAATRGGPPQDLAERLADSLPPFRPAPVHLWNPPISGRIDIRIDRDGGWHHEGEPILREGLVRLFASVLRREADGGYVLVTPVEKVAIEVADVPFLAVDLSATASDPPLITFRTNLGEEVPLDADHPHSRAANVTVAIGSSNETYDALDSMFRASLKPHPRIEYFFSSDLKFLRVVLGQPGCSAKFFCSHCEAPHINKARYDPTKSQVRDMEPEFTLIPWDPAEPWRTCGQNEHYLRSVDRCAFLLDHGGKNNMGQIKKPIIIMEFECIVPDTLHLMMRSLEKLVHEIAVHLFYGAKQHTTARSNTGVGRPTAESARYRRQVVADFAAAISEVLDRKFSFAWKDGFPDRPSFIGHDCEKFCRAAPEILLSDAYRPYHQAIDSYCSIFSMLMRSNRNVTDDDIHSLEQHIKTFASEIMHSTCLERLPNSIHVLRYHVMPYVRRYRSTLLEFSQQGVEAMIGGYRRALQNTSKRDANARLRALLEHDNIVCMWPKHKEPLKCASCRQTGHGNATSHQCPKNKSKRQPSATPTRAKQGTFAGQMYSLYQ